MKYERNLQDMKKHERNLHEEKDDDKYDDMDKCFIVVNVW